jgi:hypothetical protein
LLRKWQDTSYRSSDTHHKIGGISSGLVLTQGIVFRRSNYSRILQGVPVMEREPAEKQSHIRIHFCLQALCGFTVFLCAHSLNLS